MEDVNLGDQFIAYNSASQDRLGIIEVVDTNEDSCLCSVFDRMENVEFWEERIRISHETGFPAPLKG